ncbi:hypothetical protein HJG60_010851 [Phyllostomus discolor]|uniref:Uncharacterized protein n=1 Tax=Phyllostomus discolor TaxID=89673 RepID=A0A834AH41_9CHIR|nr:hypothetical protein HJG60_010851 [Phyllostomus discolor]
MPFQGRMKSRGGTARAGGAERGVWALTAHASVTPAPAVWVKDIVSCRNSNKWKPSGVSKGIIKRSWQVGVSGDARHWEGGLTRNWGPGLESHRELGQISSMAHISEETLSFQFPENLSSQRKMRGMFFSSVNFPVIIFFKEYKVTWTW